MPKILRRVGTINQIIMNKTYYVLAVILLSLLSSCSSKSSSSKSEPKKAEHFYSKTDDFSSGMLARYIEASTANLYVIEENNSKSLLVKITIRRRDNAPKDFEGVDVYDINFTKLLSIATLKVQDKDGLELAELSLKPEDALTLKKFVNGEETLEDVSFVGEVNDPDEVLERAYYFTPYLTADIEKKGSSSAEPDESISNEDSMSSSSDSEDWDALLDSYEEYVDEYISYVKKAAQGDMNALTEYPSLMKKAEEFSKKMQGAKGLMSASQWARYNKITMKMANAAQEMQ